MSVKRCALTLMLTLTLQGAEAQQSAQPQSAPARPSGAGVPNGSAVSRPAPERTRIVQLATPIPAAPPRTDYAGQITRMIRSAQQVVMYLPTLKRADVAEAVRLALLERGTNAIILTNEASLMEPNSYTFRLLLMGNPTYYAPAGGQPFIIIDGKTYIGAGLTQAGPLYQAPTTLSQQTIRWGQNVLNTGKPLEAREVMKRWSLKNLGIKLN